MRHWFATKYFLKTLHIFPAINSSVNWWQLTLISYILISWTVSGGLFWIAGPKAFWSICRTNFEGLSSVCVLICCRHCNDICVYSFRLVCCVFPLFSVHFELWFALFVFIPFFLIAWHEAAKQCTLTSQCILIEFGLIPNLHSLIIFDWIRHYQK